MPKCVRCGKKGLFLSLSPNGFCEDCDLLNKAEKRKAEEDRIVQMRAERDAAEKARQEDRERRLNHICGVCGKKSDDYYMNDWCYECAITKIDQNSPELGSIILPTEINGLPAHYRYEGVGLFTKPCLDDPLHAPILARRIRFEKEPANEYDSNAVAVYTFEGLRVGYVFRGSIQDMINSFIDKDLPIFACITCVDDDTAEVKMDIVFYKSKHTASEKTFSLTGSSKSDAQDTLMFVKENDDVDIEYDYDKEKYYADCGGFIGYFPASASVVLENYKNAFVSEVCLDDNLKYKAKITINL